ncbi:hypothetical protein D9M71_98570 [compost metagenome]
MQAQRAVRQVQAVVEQYLVQVGRIAQVLLLQGQRIGVQGLVALHRMALGVALLQIRTQAILLDHLAYLILQGLGVSLQVFKRDHGERSVSLDTPVYRTRSPPSQTGTQMY